MQVSNYQRAKIELKNVSIAAKKRFKNDKPAINETINVNAYFLESKYSLSDYQIELLHNYACTLHP